MLPCPSVSLSLARESEFFSVAPKDAGQYPNFFVCHFFLCSFYGESVFRLDSGLGNLVRRNVQRGFDVHV